MSSAPVTIGFEKMDYFDRQVAWSGERVPRSMAIWACNTRRSLLKAFPPGERAFCRMLDKLRFRLPPDAKYVLHYRRQKEFHVTAEFVFFGDFYFKVPKLLVEIDGSGHDTTLAIERDKWRSSLIAAKRVTTVRFTDTDIADRSWREIQHDFIISVMACCGRRDRTILNNAIMSVSKLGMTSRVQ